MNTTLKFLLRPIYRAFFKKPLRWGFARLRAFFLADLTAHLRNLEHLSAQLRDAEANLAGQMHSLRAEIVPYLQHAEITLSSLEPRIAAQLRSLESNNTAQWDGLEQLLLAMFRLPQPRTSAADDPARDEPPYLKAIDLNQVHAASNLR